MSPPTRSQLCHTIEYTAPGSLERFRNPKCEGVLGRKGDDAYKDFLRVQKSDHWLSAIDTHLKHASIKMLGNPRTVHSSWVVRPREPGGPVPTLFRFRSWVTTHRGQQSVTTRFLDRGTKGLDEIEEPCTLLENSLHFGKGTRELTTQHPDQWRRAARTIHAAMADHGYTKPKCQSIVEWMEGDVAFAGLAEDALMITFWPPAIPTHSGDSVQTFMRWDFTKDGLTDDIPEIRALIPSSRSGS